jgi:hypothetical protein
LVQNIHGDRIFLGITYAAVERITDYQCTVGAFLIVIDIHNVGKVLYVLTAHCASTKFARAVSGTITMPAVHPLLLA